MLSKLIYFLINIPRPPDNVLQNINRMLYGFLWSGKRDKVKREVMIKSCRDGGIGMVDIFMLNKALKLTWMKRLFPSSRKKTTQQFPSSSSKKRLPIFLLGRFETAKVRHH